MPVADRAQALAWRRATAQFARDPSIERVGRHRKRRGGPDEGCAVAMRRAAGVVGQVTTTFPGPAAVHEAAPGGVIAVGHMPQRVRGCFVHRRPHRPAQRGYSSGGEAVAAILIDAETQRLFEMIDTMNAEGFAAAFTADGSFRFGNAEPVAGREAVRDAVAGFFSTIGGLRHRVTGVWTGTWEHGSVRSVEAEVIYTRKDGSVTPPIPATSTLRMRGGLVQDYRIFVDVTPLFAAGPDTA